MQLFELDGPVARVVHRMAATRWFRAIAPYWVPQLDRFLYRLTRGRFMLSQLLTPMLILVTTGRKSGLQRETPLLCLLDPDGSWWVVGSNYAKPQHPAWTANLLANPDAIVRFGRTSTPVRAHLLDADRREAQWPELIAHWPVYDHYTEQSGRELRVFHLVPTPAPTPPG